MEAIVLVGGQGTRLRPLTLSTPKPMLPVANLPFVTHQLVKLRAAGVEHVVFATSYRAEAFSSYFGDGASLGLHLEFATEEQALDTGGGIRNVAPLLRSGPDDPVIVLNGDNLFGHDMSAQVAVHRASAADVTLYLVEVDDPSAFGCVPSAPDGRVLQFLEKTPVPPTNRINAGCYVFRRSVVDSIPAGEVVSVERVTFPGLLSSGAVVMSYVEPAYWLDVGTPRAMVRASADIVLGRVPGAAAAGVVLDGHADGSGVAGVAVGAGVTVGDGVAVGAGGVGAAGYVHPHESVADVSAGVDGASLSAGSAIGARAMIEPGASVAGSIVMTGARIGPDAQVIDSVIGPGAVVGPGCLVRDAVIGDGARVGGRNEIVGLRLWSDAVLGNGALRL